MQRNIVQQILRIAMALAVFVAGIAAFGAQGREEGEVLVDSVALELEWEGFGC